MKERIVILESATKRYAKSGKIFHVFPYYDDSIGNYVTGQELSSKNPGGLTKEQIEGKEPLTEAQRKKYPYPITMKDGKRIPLWKRKKFDLSKDDNDEFIHPDQAAIYNFIIIGLGEVVAKDKGSVNTSTHLFYLNDPEAEAEQRVKSKREVFKLQKMITDKLDDRSFYELVLTLNYNTNTNYNVTKLSPIIIEDIIFEAAEKYPDTVRKHFALQGQRELFILKLVHYGIISRIAGSFQDKQDNYLGTNLGDVLDYMKKKDNQLSVTAWGNALAKQDDNYAKSLESK
jgi:hypothetical protein